MQNEERVHALENKVKVLEEQISVLEIQPKELDGSVIEVVRQKFWLGGGRNFHIWVNGERVDTVTRGESRTLSVEPGRSTVRVSCDECSSNTIELDLLIDERAVVEITSISFLLYIFGPIFGIMIALGLYALYYYTFVGALLTLFFLTIYYVTYYRKKILKLRRVS